MKKQVTHHTALKSSGGAARVAEILHKGLIQSGHDSRLSFEADEVSKEPPADPGRAAAAIDSKSIVHLHSSADTSLFLENLPPEAKVIATMHDLSMVTGGCPYPLDCPAFMKGCPDPCPRNFKNSEHTRNRSINNLIERNVRLISPSGWLARKVHKAASKLKPKVIPNGIPWPETMPEKAAARAELGINPASRVILFAAHGGMEAPYKAGPRWKNIWHEIKRQVPQALGFACGGQDFKVEEDFHIWPYVSREKLGRLMAASDVLLYPTRADNHPLVVLEAMASGLACVSFAVGGVPEQIINGENGILVKEKDNKGLISEAVGLLMSPPRCSSLGKNAFHGGKKRFGKDRMLASYMKEYDKLV